MLTNTLNQLRDDFATFLLDLRGWSRHRFRTLTRFCAILLALASGWVLPGCSPPASSRETNVHPYRFTFGQVVNGQIVTVPFNRIPFEPGSEYGWKLDLENPQGTVVVREVFTLPAPTAWTFDNAEKPAGQTGGDKNENVKIQQSGRVFSNEMEITAQKKVSHLSTYKILASDPLGAYVLEIFLDGKPAARIQFTLVKEQPASRIRLL